MMLVDNNNSDEDKDLLCSYAANFFSAYLAYMYFPTYITSLNPLNNPMQQELLLPHFTPEETD